MVDNGWTARFDIVDIENEICPDCAGAVEFLDDQCPGCADDWPNCDLMRYDLTEEERHMLSTGFCPRRCNGLFRVNHEASSVDRLQELRG